MNSLAAFSSAVPCLGARFRGSLHGVIAVVVRGLIAVSGLIVLVGQAVFSGILLSAIPGAFVEGLVLQLAHVGNESNSVGAVSGGDGIFDVSGIHRFGQSAHSAQAEGQRQEESNDLLHE